MKLIKNQKGLTLVELLGALTLVFILGIGAFATLSNSLNLFQRESNRIDVRGQANIIANQLTTFYQENKGFQITPEDNGVWVRDRDGVEERNYSLSGHKIMITRYGLEDLEWVACAENEEADFIQIIIRIEEIDTEHEPFELKTVVSRLR